MSMNNYGGSDDKPITEQEGVMFAANPVWERGKKRRGFGRKAAPAATVAPIPTVTPEPRTFAAERDYEEPMALDRPIDRPIDRPDPVTTYAMGPAAATPSTLAAEEPDAGLVAPIGRPTTRVDRQPKSRGIGPAAIAAGAIALVAAGGVGWYAMQDRDGVPELTPGVTTSEVASAPLPPVDMPASDPSLTAQNVLPQRAAPAAAEPPRQVARVERRTTTTRTRPAAASADTSGINASGTAAIPSAPQPYSALNPSTVNPAPAPTQAAPEPIPSTPPTVAPEPTPAPQETPETVTPPQ